MNFKEIFDNISEECKINFLYNAVCSDKNLKNSLLEYKKSSCDTEFNKHTSIDNFADAVSNSAHAWIEELENLNFEPDWESYIPRHSEYIEEWEAMQHIAEDAVNEVFKVWHDEIFDMLLEQRIEDATIEILAMYKASLDSKVEDEYENFDTVNDYFIEQHSLTLAAYIEKIPKAVLPKKKLKETYSLLLNYLETNFADVEATKQYFSAILEIYK